MRRVLVTGANKGIGYALVSTILDHHADTFAFLGSRDLGRGERARASLLEAHPDWAPRLAVIELDVTSADSVVRAAEQVAGRFADELQPLYGVVNNAGIGFGDFSLEEVVDVNVLGVERVCDAFLPLLAPRVGRVVNVTGGAGPIFVQRCSPEWRRCFVDPNWREIEQLFARCAQLSTPAELAALGLGDGDFYGMSKACANAYTVMLARQHEPLRINACTPGLIETDLTRPLAAAVGKPPLLMGMRPPAHGARAPMLLLFADTEGTGHFYGSDGERSPLDRFRMPGSPPHRDA